MDYIGSLATLSGIIAISAISPGPNFVIVSSTAMRGSRKAGLGAGLGLAGASLTWTVLAIFGLGLLLAHATWIIEAIRIVGAVYIIYLGVKMILGARKALDLSCPTPQVSPWISMRKAYFVSMGNPKSLAFYGSIFALMIPPHAPIWFYMAIIMIATSISAVWHCGVALMFSSSAVQRGFARVKTSVETAIGLCLVGIGGKLLVET